MGNSVSGLPYEEGEKVVFQSDLWELSQGARKTEEKEPVTIFKFKTKKSSANPSTLAIAQRSVTKLKSLKHPYVVSFIDSVDAEEDLILVTESVIPLETWLQNRRDSGAAVNDIIQEVSWGFKCLLTALDFLHTKGMMTHSFICLESIYVCPNGDWKLGSFELACKGGVYEDENFLRSNNQHLPRDFQPPERERFEDHIVQRAKGAIDIFSLAVCMQKVFNKLVETPQQYNKYLKAMLQPEIAKRPRAGQILRSDLFKNDSIRLMDKADGINTKTNTEICDMLETFSSVDPNGLSSFLVSSKIVPALSHAYKVAIKDFPVREAREVCRRIIGLSTDLLAKYAELDKIDTSAYEKHFANAMVDLWGMSDRAVRTCLLVSLRHLVALTPATLASKNIFDPMLAGFADSNPKMREETLKNLVYVLDKIDETQIRDKLLRSINNLQGDQEASLRTNATIFLGKLSSRVAEEVRHRAIYPGFARAMKDPFVHCRIAGLKSTLACLSIIDKPFFATKLLPQVCALTVDGNSIVRELAINVIEESLHGLKDLNGEMKSQQAAKEAERERLGVAEKERLSASNIGGIGDGSGNQSYASTMSSNSSSGSMGSYGSAGLMVSSSHTSNGHHDNDNWNGNGNGAGTGNGYGYGNGRQPSYDRGSGERDLLDFGDNNLGGSSGRAVRGSLPPSAPVENDGDGWGDDDWDVDDSPPSKNSTQSKTDLRGIGGLKLNSSNSNPVSSRPSSHMDDPFADLGRPQAPVVVKASPSKSKPVRVRGQKLNPKSGGDNDGWDDF